MSYAAGLIWINVDLTSSPENVRIACVDSLCAATAQARLVEVVALLVEGFPNLGLVFIS
jgi:hypothetical protein